MSPGRKELWQVSTLPDSGEGKTMRGRERQVPSPSPAPRMWPMSAEAEKETTSTEAGYLYSGKERRRSPNDQAEERERDQGGLYLKEVCGVVGWNVLLGNLCTEMALCLNTGWEVLGRR